MSKRKMINTKHKVTDKWFKTITKEPFFIKGAPLPHKEVRYLQIPSLKAWYNFLEQSEIPKDCEQCSSSRDDSIEDPWRGTTTWNDYIELLDKGDDKVIEQIKLETQRSVTELEKRYDKEISGYKFDVSGQFFDIGLVLTGIPEAWLEPEYGNVEIPRVVMRIDMGFTAGVNSKDVIKNGAKLLGMAKVLENMGVEVAIELYGFQCNWHNEYEKSHVIMTSLTAKDFNEPINYRKLSSLLTTSHFRRGIFRLLEVIGDKNLSGGYGNQPEVDGFVRIRSEREIKNLEKEIFKGLEDGKVD
jgi:hypothetical protein